MIIRLKVFEQTLSIADTKSVPRKGSKDYLVLQFLFSSDWKDLNKICYLQRGEVSQPIDVVDGLVEVPEWFTQQDSFDVTLFGKGGTQEVPTNVVSLRLEKSNTLWAQDAPEPQPSWLAKVIDINNHPPIPGENGYWLIWDTDKGAYVGSKLPLPAGGSGGTSDHSKLINRGNADQHPMSAVTGLVEALNGKQPKGYYLTQDNLQSATNVALEQAKASGEFDGTDGITPNIGDNGNWYLGATDTGKPSRGEKGDPGDTPDMTAYRTAEAQNVIDAGKQNTLIQSGATVGQIAKITAVDDSGKPTAWEPVDLPKPDEYVVLFHKTFATAVANTDEWGGESHQYQHRHFWTVDTDGNAVYADGIFFRIHVPAQTDNIVNSGELVVRVGQRAVTNWMSWYEDEAKPYIGWSSFVLQSGQEVWAEQNFDLREQILSGTRATNQTYRGNFSGANTSRAVPFSYALGLRNIEYFSGVQIDLVSGSFPAGTEILIYARKYDANKIKNIPKWGAT